MQRRLVIARSAAILSGLSGLWALVLVVSRLPVSPDSPWSGTDALSAAAFCLLATALWLLSPASAQLPLKRTGRYRSGIACAVLVMAVGLTPFLLNDPLRMSVTAGIGFVLSGLALLTLDVETRPARRPSEWLAFAIGIVSLLAVLGYLYGVRALQVIGASSMPIQSAVTFLAISVGLLSTRAQFGIAAVLVSKAAGGVMTRRLIPAAVLIPPIMGWLCVLIQRSAGFQTSIAWPLLICSLVVIFTVLICRNGIVLNRLDARREELETGTRDTQRLFQTIIDNSPTIIYAKDLEGRYLLVNQKFHQLMQVEPDNILGRTDFELFDNTHALAYRAMDLKAVELGTAVTDVEMIPHADGPRYFLSAKSPLRDSAGRTYGVFGVSTDISDRKRAETERSVLLEREQFAREEAEALYAFAQVLASEPSVDKIVQSVTDAATRLTRAQFGAFFQITIDRRGEKLVLFNLSGAPREAFEHFGIPRNTAIFEPTFRGAAPMRIADVLADPRYGLSEPHKGMPKGHLPVRSYLAVPVVARDGSVLGGLFFGHGDPGIFDERAERIAVGIASQAAVAVENAKLYEGLQESTQRLATQLGQLRLLDQITRAIGQRQDLSNIWKVVLRELEENFAVDFACVMLCDDDGKTLTITEICDKGRAIALALGSTEGAKISIDGNGLSRAVHGHFVHEADISSSKFELLGRLAGEGLRDLVISPLFRESAVFGVLVAARREANSFSSVECEFLRQLSDHVGLAAYQAQLYGSLERAYADLQRSQDTLLQQARLRAVGQMASGIAHDINNAMSPASLYAESLLEHETSLSPRARDALLIIQRAIADVAQTVARMRGLYGPRAAKSELVSVDINALIQQVVELTRPRWSDIPQERGVLIQLSMDLDPARPQASGVEHEIRDSLTNLVFNAVDALPDGGSLTIRSRRNTPPSVLVEVIDNGVGMDEETRQRCLEPFFSTKGERGSGLGLAMVYSMAQRNGATLQVESAIGRGTTISLAFREWQDASEPPKTRPAVPTVRPLRILVIDDDPSILRSLAEILEHDGHVVSKAEGGEAGLHTFLEARRQGNPYEMVFTDLGMPKMDGRRVATEIRSVEPSVPIVMLTGWGHRMSTEDDVPAFVDRVLSKPPKIHELRLALKELILDAGTRRPTPL